MPRRTLLGVLEAKNHQLQTLVGELLATNQELRFKVAQLEEETKSLETRSRAVLRGRRGTVAVMDGLYTERRHEHVSSSR